MQDSTHAAIEAFRRGYQAVPIRDESKRPLGAEWTRTQWESEEQIRASFDSWREHGASGVGLVLGAASGGLIDVDLDHEMSLRMQDYFLPPSAMKTGRRRKARSHRWYRVEGDLPATRRYLMPDRSVTVELRSTGAQTVIPPSTWWPKKGAEEQRTDSYVWEGQPWGGDEGPALIEGRKLAIQVALLGLGSVLLEVWPRQGSRHEAYLALAGGLLRHGDGVHPYWERNLPVLITALADATHDEDGPEARVAEVMGTTIERLNIDGKAVGFPRLSELLGVDHAEQARRMAKEVEALSGFVGQPITRVEEVERSRELTAPDTYKDELLPTTLPPEVRNPMEERISTWAAVDLEPYLSGEVELPEPSLLLREDGQALVYPGRVNSIYGLSESAKTWIAMFMCSQEMGRGERVMFIDFEDEPAGTLARMLALGVGADDLYNQFRYVHPEGPLADMQRYRFGHSPTPEGTAASEVFWSLLDTYDPTLIVADGMTVLYGLHGHDTNEATATDVITSWLKSMCRGGRTTVMILDHSGKNGGAGSSPVGAHHKIAMVQGSSLRADPIIRPMRGELGSVQLVVYKDRPGAVRAISSREKEQVAGTVYIDSRVEGVTKMWIEPPVDGDFILGSTESQSAKLASLAETQRVIDQILPLFGGDVDLELKTSEVMTRLDIDAESVRAAWDLMVKLGQVERLGSTRWTRFKLKLQPPVEGQGQDVD